MKLINRDKLKSPWMGRKKTDTEDDDPNAFSVFFRSPSTFSGESNNKNDQENLKSLRSSLGLQPRKIRTSSTQNNMLKDNVLHPPKEVMIDPNAIPPSPMRYPDMSETQRMPREVRSVPNYEEVPIPRPERKSHRTCRSRKIMCRHDINLCCIFLLPQEVRHEHQSCLQ